MKLVKILAAAMVLATTSSGVYAKELVVFSAGAVKSAVSALVPVWEARSGHRLLVTYAAAGDLRWKRHLFLRRRNSPAAGSRYPHAHLPPVYGANHPPQRR